MEYTIKAHKTFYKGVLFRSRLEARWAAFFDLIGWEWEYEPFDLPGWTPDFLVVFACDHSECNGSHSLLVEIKPYLSIDEFDGHPCMDYPYGTYFNEKGKATNKYIPADSSAAFGNNPDVTYWEIAHGSGGGIENIYTRIHYHVDLLWKSAGNMVQYNPDENLK